MKWLKSLHKVVNGKITNAEQLKTNVEHYEGKIIEVRVKEYKPQRSNEQNKYYWAVIVPNWMQILKEEWGEIRTIEETHEFLKYNANYKEKVNQETGEIFKLSRSTTENNTKEFEEFTERCRQLAFDNFNITIPLPNEQTRLAP